MDSNEFTRLANNASFMFILSMIALLLAYIALKLSNPRGKK